MSDVSDFRIFIDAATLKQTFDVFLRSIATEFPHLYRCGHIEGSRPYRQQPRRCAHFRIFIDAATLKMINGGAGRSIKPGDFRIFIDAATLKVLGRPNSSVE